MRNQFLTAESTARKSKSTKSRGSDKERAERRKSWHDKQDMSQSMSEEMMGGSRRADMRKSTSMSTSMTESGPHASLKKKPRGTGKSAPSPIKATYRPEGLAASAESLEKDSDAGSGKSCAASLCDLMQLK